MSLYRGHFVRLEWQSPHDTMNCARVCGLSQDGSAVTGGLVWSRP